MRLFCTPGSRRAFWLRPCYGQVFSKNYPCYGMVGQYRHNESAEMGEWTVVRYRHNDEVIVGLEEIGDRDPVFIRSLSAPSGGLATR
jgi:hypothetical protein